MKDSVGIAVVGTADRGRVPLAPVVPAEFRRAFPSTPIPPAPGGGPDRPDPAGGEAS
jgi:hypothetical protein